MDECSEVAFPLQDGGLKAPPVIAPPTLLLMLPLLLIVAGIVD
jgi:hypothetical protein